MSCVVCNSNAHALAMLNIDHWPFNSGFLKRK